MSIARSRRLSRLRSVAFFVTAFIAAGLCAVHAADDRSSAQYPTTFVKLVVPFPAGGPLDFIARSLADKLSASLKQPFVVENRPGAGGNVGVDAVIKAVPDGYTLLMTLDTPLTVNPSLYKKLAFNPERDLDPISVVASFSQMLVVHPSVPVSTVAEFVAFAKSTSLTYGSGGGNGNPGQLTMEFFRSVADFGGVQVPYKGNMEVVTGLLAGQVQAGFVATPGVINHAKEHRLKALGVSSLQRAVLAPDVPTIAESGYPGFEVGFYHVLLAPKGTPQTIRALLEREVRQALQDPDLQARIRAQSLELIASSSVEARALLKAAAERWARVIKAANISVD